jgi:hypothetical protein
VGGPDPEGGTRAARLVNTGALLQDLQQTVDGPGWFHYCFSLYAKGAEGTALRLFRSSAETTVEKTFALSAAWRRFVLSGAAQTSDESVTFGLILAPGATLDVFGVQAEAQPAPSCYRTTTSHSGIHPNSRFDSDSLIFTSEGPEQHACKVCIVSPVTS